jgi:hypothetical protein
MAERKPISKKLRFEVFKRDKFTCQYCGRMSPDVILEVDHIKPVSDGGKNELINLVTSCRDCNRGKGKVKLSDDAEIKKQQRQLIDMADKKEQLEMMIGWRDELLDIEQKQVDSIEKLIESLTGYGLTQHGRTVVLKHIKNFSYLEVYEATEISFIKYFEDSDYSFGVALKKIGGICYNIRQKKGEKNDK